MGHVYLLPEASSKMFFILSILHYAGWGHLMEQSDVAGMNQKTVHFHNATLDTNSRSRSQTTIDKTYPPTWIP